MEESLFIQYVNKWFGPLVKKIVETVNGKKTEPTYLHMTMLKKEFSTTLKWGSLSVDGRIVAADVVSMDSSLPLKKRDAIKKAEGDIPKLGMKLYLNERTMTDIDILQATNGKEKEVIAKLFADAKKCYLGVKEQLEFMFLQGLSTGVTVISDSENVGVGVRIDFAHPDKNKYGVETPWSDANAVPITDIENVLNRAEEAGDTIRYILMDKATFNAFKAKAEVKQLFAAHLGFNGANIPTPTLKQVNEFMDDNYGVMIQVINRSITIERNGKRTSVKPWGANKVVFLTTLEVGTLTYGSLAEEKHPVEGVKYEKAEDFILLSKYHKNDPIREFTSSQALALPVINGVDEIYIMDAEEAATDTQTEADANFDYEGTSYTKQSVVDGINAANPDLSAKITNADSTLLKKINKLSDAEIEVFKAELVESV